MPGRAFARLAALPLVVLAAACGARQPVHPDPPPVPAAAAGQTLVVLLPDADGSVGRAQISTTAGSADLHAKLDAARAAAGRPPSTVEPLTEEDVTRIFGEALQALPPAPKHFILYFKFESDELTGESRDLVPAIQHAVKDQRLPEIVVVGHTDTLGKRRANFELGLKRARSVRDFLIAAGLDPSLINVTSLGESDPLVRTPDETPEPRNRRVEIAVR